MSDGRSKPRRFEGSAYDRRHTMPSTEQIRKSLEARIEQVESELRELKAAHAALTTGAEEVTTNDTTPRRLRRGRRLALGAATADEPVPLAVLAAFEQWDARGRPAQAAAAWQRDRWLAAMPAQARLLGTLPDLLDRSIVRRLVLEKPSTASGMFEAMIIVYAWGWSTTPVGVTRARNSVGAGPELVGSALLAARDAIRSGDRLDGYAALAGPHRVAGLGPSFGSKFLYFVSPQERRALILDQLVADWLAREAALSLNPTRWSIRTYGTYLTTMRRWSARVGIPDHQLEEVLFTEEATRRGLTAWAARR